MNRINKLSLGLFFILGSVWAQTQPISSIRILTEPQGARFYVDGQVYTSAQVFLWPKGSKHTLQFPLFQTAEGVTDYQLSLDGNIHWVFNGWRDNRSLLIPGTATDQTITADPSITEYKATLTPNYKTFLRFSEAPTALPTCGAAPGDPPQDAPRAGLVYIGSTCFGSNAEIFAALGTVPLNAFPYPGWVFLGWSVNGGTLQPSLGQFNHTGVDTLYAIFAQGKRVKFVTEPFGMQLLIDRTPVPTSGSLLTDIPLPYDTSAIQAVCDPDINRLPPNAPKSMAPLCYGEFDFYPGSAHTIGAPSPQYDKKGRPWVFNVFSNGVNANGVYTPDNNTSTKDIVVGMFTPATKASIITSPQGLKVSVDGRDNWGSYNFVWAAGSKHHVTAPATQVYNGRTYTFKSWSNGGAADQDITPDPAATDWAITAIFDVQPQVTLKSNPSGVTLTVDGQPCKTPCVLNRAKGTTAAVTAPTQISQSDLQRLDLVGWSDSGSSSRSIAFNSDTQVLTANYQTSFRLSLIADPAGSATFQVTPASADNFYAAGSVLNVVATANRGYKFRRFDGDITGTSATGAVTMFAAESAIAYFDKVAFIPSAGIKNAAGDTPETGLAPNSVFAIYGDNLAGEFQVGQSNPLSQTIGGAAVVIKPGDRIASLLIVSPTQINGIIPSDLAEGAYTMNVQWNGQNVSGDFKVVRNAPGLFTTSVGSSQFVVATHADGSLVNQDSPATKGETINVYGTGFGPYDHTVVDGFTIPGSITYKVVDLVEATLGDQKATVTSSQAASDMAGTTLTKIVIPSGAASGSPSLTFKVNGKSSNSVLVPVQ